MRVKTGLKKEDKVKVIAGKDKGKIGKILKVDRKENRVFVENINKVKRHVKPNMQNRQGGIIEKEASIHSSNVMLLCSQCMKPTRISHKILEDGKKVRVCSKCSEVIK